MRSFVTEKLLVGGLLALTGGVIISGVLHHDPAPVSPAPAATFGTFGFVPPQPAASTPVSFRTDYVDRMLSISASPSP